MQNSTHIFDSFGHAYSFVKNMQIKHINLLTNEPNSIFYMPD